MGEVGTKLDKTTQAGRDVYVTPEGEYISEKSTTFKYNDKWINVPSIFNGYRYNDDTIRLMLDEGVVQPTSTHNNKEDAENAARKRSNELEFNKGGTPMMEKQMEMFEDGGLKDEGGMIDKESGNDVPIGSTRKEVRDDIPAKLSEGEFVFPADVVRFIGLEKLMTIRQKAKMGLQRMEEMGQMGNSDEATMPDDMPFGMSDLIIMSPEGKEVEMAEGGVIHAATGVNVTPSNNPTMTNVQKVNNTGSTYTPYTTGASVVPLPTQPVPTKPVVTASGPPKFPEVMGDAAVTMRQYKNAAGYVMMIPHIGGKPMYPVPEGYVLVAEDGTTPEMDKEGIPAENAEETVAPEEPDYGGEVDSLGMAPGSVGSASSLSKAAINFADITLNKKDPTKIETIIMNNPFYKLAIKGQLKAANIDTGDEDLDMTSLALHNAQNALKTAKPGTQEHKDVSETVTELAYTQYAQSKTLAKDVPGAGTPTEGVTQFTDKTFDDLVAATKAKTDPTLDIENIQTGSVAKSVVPSFKSISKDAPSTSIDGPKGSSPRSSPSQSPRGGGVPDRGGNGNGNGRGGNSDGSGSGSGGVSADMSGPFNQGGLAGKKPKKKMKTYKKGGLATSKK